MVLINHYNQRYWYDCMHPHNVQFTYISKGVSEWVSEREHHLFLRRIQSMQGIYLRLHTGVNFEEGRTRPSISYWRNN
jgi:hypothetical protein